MDFIKVTLIDFADVLLVALLIYYIYRVIKGTAAMNIFLGIILLCILYLVVRALKMELLTFILGQVLGVGLLALVILFQQEIRRFLMHLGTKYIARHKNWVFFRFFFSPKNRNLSDATIDSIVKACYSMSSTHTGALIVIARQSDLDLYTETGDIIDAQVSSRLLENIFFKNTPLHDGAVIILNDRIRAARCVLPTTENINIPAHYGMRHRAALGVTEQSDAVVVVVSEETGSVSFVDSGEIFSYLSDVELKAKLTAALSISTKSAKNSEKEGSSF